MSVTVTVRAPVLADVGAVQVIKFDDWTVGEAQACPPMVTDCTELNPAPAILKRTLLSLRPEDGNTLVTFRGDTSAE